MVSRTIWKAEVYTTPINPRKSQHILLSDELGKQYTHEEVAFTFITSSEDLKNNDFPELMVDSMRSVAVLNQFSSSWGSRL